MVEKQSTDQTHSKVVFKREKRPLALLIKLTTLLLPLFALDRFSEVLSLSAWRLKQPPPTASLTLTVFDASLLPYTADKRCPELSKQLLQDRSKDNTIMLAVANYYQHEFLTNWLHTVVAAGIDYYIVGATDKQTSKYLAANDIPCFEHIAWVDTDQDSTWGSENWRIMTWQKVMALDTIIDYGLITIVSDVDVVWFRDPLPYIPRQHAADIIFSHDYVWSWSRPTDKKQLLVLEQGANVHWDFNTGLYIIYPTNRSSAFVHRWRAAAEELNVDDQRAAHVLIRQGDFETAHRDNPSVKASGLEENKLWVGLAAVYVFASGHSFMVSKMHELMGLSPQLPLAMHATWTYDGMTGKKSRIREAKMWYDPPEYYSEGNFITVTLQVPTMPSDYNEWKTNEDMILFHLAALETQLEQIYIGLSIAVATNRIFIFPAMTCFCERIWYAVTLCRMWDAEDMQFPIVCPADYYFYLDRFSTDDEAVKLGPPIPIREHSFLDNPRTPETVSKSYITIHPSSSQLDGSSSSSNQVVVVPISLYDDELMVALEEYKDVRVWSLDFNGLQDVWEAYNGFRCESRSRQFDARMQQVLQDWCCRFPEDAKALNKTETERLSMTRFQGQGLWKKKNKTSFAGC